MDSSVEYFSNLMEQLAILYIEASPNYLLDFIITIVLAAISRTLCLLAVLIYKKVSIHSLSIRNFRISGNCSTESNHTSTNAHVVTAEKLSYSRSETTRGNNSSQEWLLEYRQSNVCKPILERTANILLTHKLAVALTPEEYVRLDKQRQLCDQLIKEYARSLTVLIDGILKQTLSERRLNERTETENDDTLCSRIAEQVIKQFDSQSVSESMVNTLNEIVEGTSTDD